jgi:hypothetical protein
MRGFLSPYSGLFFPTDENFNQIKRTITMKENKKSNQPERVLLHIEELEERIAPSAGGVPGYKGPDFPNHGDSAKPPGHWGPGHFPPGNHGHK